MAAVIVLLFPIAFVFLCIGLLNGYFHTMWNRYRPHVLIYKDIYYLHAFRYDAGWVLELEWRGKTRTVRWPSRTTRSSSSPSPSVASQSKSATKSVAKA